MAAGKAPRRASVAHRRALLGSGQAAHHVQHLLHDARRAVAYVIQHLQVGVLDLRGPELLKRLDDASDEIRLQAHAVL